MQQSSENKRSHSTDRTDRTDRSEVSDKSTETNQETATHHQERMVAAAQYEAENRPQQPKVTSDNANSIIEQWQRASQRLAEQIKQDEKLAMQLAAEEAAGQTKNDKMLAMQLAAEEAAKYQNLLDNSTSKNKAYEGPRTFADVFGGDSAPQTLFVGFVHEPGGSDEEDRERPTAAQYQNNPVQMRQRRQELHDQLSTHIEANRRNQEFGSSLRGNLTGDNYDTAYQQFSREHRRLQDLMRPIQQEIHQIEQAMDLFVSAQYQHDRERLAIGFALEWLERQRQPNRPLSFF